MKGKATPGTPNHGVDYVIKSLLNKAIIINTNKETNKQATVGMYMLYMYITKKTQIRGWCWWWNGMEWYEMEKKWRMTNEN